MIALICLLLTRFAVQVEELTGGTAHERTHAAAPRRFLFAMQLLDRCIEGIEIRMQDGGSCVYRHGPPAKFGN